MERKSKTVETTIYILNRAQDRTNISRHHMNCQKEDQHRLGISRYLELNATSKGMKTFWLSLTQDIMEVFFLDILQEGMYIDATTKGCRGLLKVLM